MLESTVPDDDMLHTYPNPMRVFDLDGLTMLIGADDGGRMLEVGVAVGAGVEFIVHAMRSETPAMPALDNAGPWPYRTRAASSADATGQQRGHMPIMSTPGRPPTRPRCPVWRCYAASTTSHPTRSPKLMFEPGHPDRNR